MGANATKRGDFIEEVARRGFLARPILRSKSGKEVDAYWGARRVADVRYVRAWNRFVASMESLSPEKRD